MARDRFRVRFKKGGDLRLISHHDLMRTFERMLRRANIPVHCSEGFNPKPRLVFALSLALGVVGCQEVAELELDESMEPDELCRLLAREAPAGLDILSVKRVNSSAVVRRMSYRLALSASHVSSVEPRIREVLASPHCSSYIAGERVFHQKFGYGQVLSVDGNKLTVAFDKAGEKRVVDSYVERA